MTSEKQIEANRQNAKCSSGPKSFQGKNVSRMNAISHGLTAQQIVIEGEDLDDFEFLKTQLVNEYNPATVLERELVLQLAGYIWRMRRVPVLEAAMLEAHREAVKECDSENDLSKREDPLLEMHKKFTPRFAAQQLREHSMKLNPGLPQPYTPILDDPNFVDKTIQPKKPREEVTVETEGELARKVTLNLGRALLRDASQNDALSKLARYETHLVNLIEQILKSLKQLKDQRRPEDKDGLATIEHEPLQN